MSKQYVDVSGWNSNPSTKKQYVDVSNWDEPNNKKGVIDTVVDAVVDKAHAINEAIREDTSIYHNDVKPISATEKYKLAQNSPRSPEYMANLKAQAEAETAKEKLPEPITANEKLKLAQNQADMGRRSPEYIQKLEADAAAEREVRPDIKATYDWDNSSLGHKIQTAIGDAPVRVIKSVARDTLGVVLPKTAEEMFGHDEFEKAHPNVAMAQEVIGSLPVAGMGLAKAGSMVELGDAIATAKAVKSGNIIHDAAQDILDSTAQSLGIDLPKPKANPETLIKDESIAKAIADEQGAPEISANETNVTPKITEPINPHPEGTRPADSAVATDIDVGHKEEIPPVDPKAQAQAEQDARVQAAHEEAMARKAELEAQQKSEEAFQADKVAIESHPRLQELIDMRRDVSAKQAERPNIRESDRTLIHENNGGGYETTVIPATDVKNYAHDMSLTKADIASYEKNGLTPELYEKFKKDLEVLDNHPEYRPVDPMGRVEGGKYIDEATGEEIDIPFSKGEATPEVHTPESMKQSVRSAVGEDIDIRLSPILQTISKADIPEAVLKKAGDSSDGIHGFVHEGKAYIVADNIPKEWSESQIRGLVMHEVGVHLRKAGAGDKEFGRILDAMRESNDPIIKEAYARVPENTAVHKVDEEALGYLIQAHPDTTIARRVIAWVKQQLIRLSISPMRLKLTPQDLSAMAWGAVKRGDNQIISKDTMLHARVIEKMYIDPKSGRINMNALAKEAIELPDPIGKKDFFNLLGTHSWVTLKTPAGDVRLHAGETYRHFSGNNTYYADRQHLSGALYSTLKEPLFVVEEKVKGNVTYYKPFIEKDGLTHLIGITKDGDGRLKLKTFFDVSEDRVKSMMKVPDGHVKYFKHSDPATHVGQGIASKTPSDQMIYGKGLNEEIIQPKSIDSQEVQFSREKEEPRYTLEEKQSAGGFYSAAQRAIEKMPPKMESEAFIKYLKNNGVKDDEILHSGIAKAVEGKTSITKAEIEGAFTNPVMESKTLEAPKYEKYSTEGGGNYREELTTIPSRNSKLLDRRMELANIDRERPLTELEQKEYNGLQPISRKDETYQSSHWDEPNVLLHTRKKDTIIDGDKTLLIEEIQSDWHQAGRKHGYATARDEYNKLDTQLSEIKERLIQEYGSKWISKADEYPEFVAISQKMQEAGIRMQKEYDAVPQAPMSKTWHEFGMRQIIDEAVANGYDRVAWVDGATQANRYSMSHSVDRLVYNKNFNVLAGYKDGKEIMTKSADEAELEHLIGKEPAKRLMENEVHKGIHEIKGEALDIGGDGMKGFYDKILVDYAKKYTKKWGVTVEKKTLPNGVEVHSFPVNAKMKEDIAKNGQALYAHGAGAIFGVGEDENGNLTFDPVRALVGIVGGSMIMSKTVRNAVSKLVGKSEYLSDSTIQSMVRVAIKGADKITANSITKVAEKISKNNLVDYVIGHKIYKLEDYMKLREDALRSANAGMEMAARLHLQLKELSSEAREAMYAYMSGDKNVALTPELKRAADTFISKIDTMGQEMVDEGFLTKEAYEEWKGQYLHRKYASKMKQASDWASGKGELGVDKIHMRGKTWNATEEEYQQLLKEGKIGKVSEGKTEVLKDSDGGYKLRRDWTPQERKDMGEIRDAAYSIPETVGQLAQMVEFGKMLKSVPMKYIMEQEGRSENVMRQLGYEKLSGSRYGALNGKWVNQSIAGDLKRVGNDVMGEEANIKKLYNDYVSALKMSHTIYNPTAHVNNIGSNVFLQAAGGLNPFKTIKYATDGTFAARRYGRWKELDAKVTMGLSGDEAVELAKLESNSDVKLWKELDEQKMFGRSRLNEMLRTYMAPSIDTTTGSKLHKASESMKALYQGEDDVMRFSAVKQLMDDGLWMDGTVSKMDIKEAMKYVNDTITPDYSKPMSKLALTLRDSGVVPFMSWTYYSTPILIKQLRDHPTRVLGIAGAWYGMDRLFGVDPYNDETMPKGFDSQRVAIGRDGDKVTGVRVSSMIPHIQLVQPENTFMEPLASGIPQTMLGEATNYNFYFRKPITMKTGSEGTYQRVKDAVQNVLPSPDILDKAYNIAESKVLDKETRRKDRVIEPRTPAQEAASFFINLQTYDVSHQRDYVRKDKIKEKKTERKDNKMERAMKKLFGGN